MKTSAILLAGGKGERMGHATPKQFLPLQQIPIALHSLKVLLQVEQISEIIVVCHPSYRHHFAPFSVSFALPGERRQDSLFSGLQQVDPQSEWICIHDSARPFITLPLLKTLFDEGKKIGAASLAMPVKNTLKEIDSNRHVARTLNRPLIWEIQTPQLLKKEILHAGFAYAQKHALTVTDDVSLAELIGHPVKLIQGAYSNIKITTPEDLIFAKAHAAHHDA